MIELEREETAVRHKPWPTPARKMPFPDEALMVPGPTEFQGNLPEVQLDGMELQQILLNLIRNAIDAMSPLPPEARRLRLKTSLDDQSTVSVSVEDSGPGISAGDRERIFDPFFTTKRGGMGLGLAISSNLVANYGGKLRLLKSNTNGSIFELTIPVGGQRSAASMN